MVIGIARGTAESKPPVHCIRHPLPPAVRRRVGDRRYLRKETLPDGTIFAKTPDAECRVNDHLALHSTASAQTADAPSPGCVPANKAIPPPLANSGGPIAMDQTAETWTPSPPRPRKRRHTEARLCPTAPLTHAKTQPAVPRHNLHITVDVKGTTYELPSATDNQIREYDSGKIRNVLRAKQPRYTIRRPPRVGASRI